MDIDKIKRQLGIRFKELRLSKGLKQEDLEPLGFSYRYYGKIERGLANLTLDTLIRLCNIFEVSCRNYSPLWIPMFPRIHKE
jgi:transcriptional regulator with XRE-family HTH domain